MSGQVKGKGQLHKVFASADEPIAITLQFDDTADARVARETLGAEWVQSLGTLVWHGSYEALQEQVSVSLGVPSERIEPARHTAEFGPVFQVAIAVK